MRLTEIYESSQAAASVPTPGNLQHSFQRPMAPNTSDRSALEGPKADWLEVVLNRLANLRFGSVQITVHDGHVIQVETIEKTRFTAAREDGKNKKS